MRVFFLNLSFCTSLFNTISSLFSKILCFVKKERKNSQDQASIPFTIKIQGQTQTKEIDLVDWNHWEDDANTNFEKNDVAEEKHIEDELFKDMTPVINKTKVIHVKRKVKSNQGTDRRSLTEPASMLKTKYEVKSELDIWDDEDLQNPGWDDVAFDEKEVDRETNNILKSNKIFEREKRAEEQRRRKEEKEIIRNQKNNQKLGVKIDLF